MPNISQRPNNQHNMMRSHSTPHHDQCRKASSHPNTAQRVSSAAMVAVVVVAGWLANGSRDGCIAK